MNANDHTGWYKVSFTNWQVSQLGPKPTAEMLEAAHLLGLRPGKQALHVAMCLRPNGVTARQTVIACGAPQNNRRRGLAADGLIKQVATPHDELGHTVYKFEVTQKGLKRINAAKARIEAADKANEAEKALYEPKAASKPAKGPSKAKGAPKAKKATKARVKVTPTSDAPSATEAVPAEPVPAVEQVQPDNAVTAS